MSSLTTSLIAGGIILFLLVICGILLFQAGKNSEKKKQKDDAIKIQEAINKAIATVFHDNDLRDSLRGEDPTNSKDS